MQSVRVYKYFLPSTPSRSAGLAGFVYPSSGLLPRQEPGRQISRTEGPYPRHWICVEPVNLNLSLEDMA
jgi:hypothetical protein